MVVHFVTMRAAINELRNKGCSQILGLYEKLKYIFIYYSGDNFVLFVFKAKIP